MPSRIVWLLVGSLSDVCFAVEAKASCERVYGGNGHGAAMSQIRSRLQDHTSKQDPAESEPEPADDKQETSSTSSYSNSETTNAGGKLEANLTEQVHRQARVVATSAGRLLHTTKRGTQTEGILQDEYDKINDAADEAQTEYDTIASGLKEKEAEERKLRDATQAAEQKLWKLQKDYMEAKKDYESAKNNASNAKYRADEKSSARDSYQRTMNNTVQKISSQTNELQDNIDKLNELNQDLKDLQEAAKNDAFGARCRLISAMGLLVFFLTAFDVREI